MSLVLEILATLCGALLFLLLMALLLGVVLTVWNDLKKEWQATRRQEELHRAQVEKYNSRTESNRGQRDA